MTFLAPAFLAALGALAAPVAIHLLNKLRVREVRWAAMRFLQDAVRKNARKLQLQDLILLLLRCAVLAVLVLAFARPTLDPDAREKIAAAGEGFTSVVLLDHSASMGLGNGVETRFDRARADVLAWLASLPSGSAAGLILVHDGYTSPVGRPTRDLALVRRSVELAQLTDRGTDFLPALRAAVNSLRRATGRREIHLFTDNQLAGWKDEAAVRELLAAEPGLKLVLHPSEPLPANSAPNLALTDLRPDSAVPLAGQPLRVLATVTNFGSVPAAGIRLTLAVDGNAPSADAVIPSLAPGGSSTLPLVVRLPEGARHTLTAQLPPDPLALDNRRDLAVEVSPQSEILLVESRTGPAAWQTSGHFLAAALVPVPADQAARHHLRVTRVGPAQVTAELIAASSVFIFCDSAAPAPDLLAAIAARVRDGAGLIVLPGSPASLDALAVPPLSELLPGSAAARPPSDTANSLASPPYNHPLATPWNDRNNGSLSALRFDRSLALTPAKDAAVMLAFANNEPAFLEHGVGRGRVILGAFPPVPAWTNLPLHPAFITLTHRLVARVLPPGRARLNLAPGEMFQSPVPLEQLNRDVFVQGPGADARRTAVGRTELVGGQPLLRVRDTAAAGIYRVFIGKETEQPDQLFAVQPDPAESDVSPARPDLFAAAAEATSSAAPATAARPQEPRFDARQLWFALLVFAAVFSLLELALALRTSRRPV